MNEQAAQAAYETYSTNVFGRPPAARKQELVGKGGPPPTQLIGLQWSELDGHTRGIWMQVAEAARSVT